MTSLDLAQARRHIEILYGAPNAKVCWQLFSDSQAESYTPKEYRSNSVDQLAQQLTSLQSNGYGVYITVNPTDGHGRKIENIVGYKYLFADMDGKPLPPTLPLQPCLITGRDPEHTHVYFKLDKCLTASEYSSLQRRLALALGSDTQVTDAARVARVAGTWQLKDPTNPQQYQIYYENVSAPVYTPEMVYNSVTLSEADELELERWIDSRFSYDSGTGFDDNPTYIDQARHYFEHVAKPCMEEGTNRSENLIKVACYAYDRGVSYEVTLDLLWQHFNPRCQPPWPVDKYSKFANYVKNAYRYARNEPGCKTAPAKFAGRSIPEPDAGWEANAKLCKTSETVFNYEDTPADKDIGFVGSEVAELNFASLNSKSSVHECALAFIGKRYPDRTLIRHDGIFYRYTGRVWEVVEDDEMINEIEYVMFSMELTTSKVNNILTKVGNLVYRKEVKFRSWLDHDRRKGSFTICHNGIIHVTESMVQLLPHDKNYFDLNMLEIDYDPTAKAPEFEKFLDSQWADYPDLKTQMQDCYGHALMRSSRHQIIPMLIGKSRSGKSVHVKLLTRLVGERNVCSPSLDGLADDNQVLPMANAKVAFVNEANTISHSTKDKVLDRLKLITGGDPLTVNRKYKDAQTISDWALIIMVSNVLPDFVDSSGAYANRAYPIPFFKSFHGREDKGLYDRLVRELPGILNWALQGAMRAAKYDKVFLAKESRELIEDIRYDSFPLSQFIGDLCILDTNEQAPLDDVYDAYIQHCRCTGVKTPMANKKFSRMITSSAIQINKKRVMVNDRRYYMLMGVAIDEERLSKMSPSPKGFSNVTELANVRDEKKANVG